MVVEHDEETIRSADWVIDIGPGAGDLGGTVVAEGTPDHIERHPHSLTGAYLAGRERIPVPPARRTGNGARLTLEGVRANNLKSLDVQFPLGCFICVTGVSGSGKSTLIEDVLYRALAQRIWGSRNVPGEHSRIRGLEHIDKAIEIDQSPSAAPPAPTPPPTPAPSPQSATSSPPFPSPAPAATNPAASRSTSRAAAAKPARARA